MFPTCDYLKECLDVSASPMLLFLSASLKEAEIVSILFYTAELKRNIGYGTSLFQCGVGRR